MRAATHPRSLWMRYAAVNRICPTWMPAQRQASLLFTCPSVAVRTAHRHLSTKLTPEQTPAPFLKVATDADAVSTRCVVHTGYSSPSSSTYTVVDAKAFEDTIANAAHASVVEMTLPVHATEADGLPRQTRNAAIVHTALSRHLTETYALEKSRLDALLAKKAPIDRYVDKLYYPLLKYGCCIALTLQLGLYFNWIFFVFDWNLMEPTTYFLAYTGVFFSLVYHYVRCGHDELTWKNMFTYLADRERAKMCERAKVDVGALASLQMRVRALEKEIGKYELKP